MVVKITISVIGPLLLLKYYQMMKEIHIGSIIKEKIKEKGIKVTNFADSLHCNRYNIYSIFKRRNIDLQLLTRISAILDCDLLTEYQKNNPRTNNIVVIEVDDLKMKEIQSDSLIKILYTKNV